MPERLRKLRVVRFPVDPVNKPEEWHALRAGDITASVVGALFGLHPHQTMLGLFAEKSGIDLGDEEDSIAMRRGRILEDGVCKAFQEECGAGWKIKKAKLYLREPNLRLGATPDFFVTDPNGRRGVLQAKTVAPHVFRRYWSEETPPTWISLQTLTEMMLWRAEFGIIAALEVDGYKFALHRYDVPRHEAAERRIQDAVTQFWSDFGAGREPKIDYEKDASLLPVLYPHSVAAKIADLRADNALPALLDERDQLKDEIATKGKRVGTIETELKFKMTDAEVALVRGWRITNKEQHRKAYEVQATSFRVLRINRDQVTNPKEERAA